jgi:hypothetical protein
VRGGWIRRYRAPEAGGLSVLAACGEFGEEMRREALNDHNPTTEH